MSSSIPSSLTDTPGPTERREAAGQPDCVPLHMLVVLSALMGLGNIATDMYLPALPAMAQALKAAPGQMEFTISGYLIGFGLGQLLWGPLGDRLGRKGPVAAGLALFVVATIGCALSTSVATLTLWRVAQALGASVGPVLSRAMVRDLYARDRAAQMLSTLITIMAVAPLAAPILGGQIVALWSWQGIFWLIAVCGSAGLLALQTIPETLPPSRRDPTPLREAFASYASLLREKRLVGYALTGGFYYAGIFAYIAGTPFAYIEYYGVDPRLYGLLFGLAVAVIMGANVLNARFVRRFGADRILRAATVVLAIGGILVMVTTRTGWGGLPGLVAALLLYSSMSGFIVANSVAGALAAFPRQAGAASALVGSTHYVMGMLSAGMVGAFADGTPWPMGWIIGAGGILSFTVTRLLLPGISAANASTGEMS
jgi:DHA1 family bicyclomycin/chloramphenicol resistance-like MFS transporter